MFQLICLVFTTLNIFALNEAQLPVIQAGDFTVGRAWTWDYSQTDTGERTSSETYTVIERTGSKVLIEMSSMLADETQYRAHHRLLVDVDRCLAAYPSASLRRPWSFRMYYFSEGLWQEMVPPTTLAFEEKFNCNPWVMDSSTNLTVFRDGPRGREFMHMPNRRIEASWFSEAGSDPAVLSEKPFTRRPGFPSYVSRRR